MIHKQLRIYVLFATLFTTNNVLFFSINIKCVKHILFILIVLISTFSRIRSLQNIDFIFALHVHDS